jgi:hypothetical protein
MSEQTPEEPEEEVIHGNYPEFAREVRRLLKWKAADGKISSRAAARKTDISHSMITTMADGDRPRMELVIKFGLGMKADVNRLLRAAGYPEVKEPDDTLDQLRAFFETETALDNDEWPTDPEVQKRIWMELRRLRAMVRGRGRE